MFTSENKKWRINGKWLLPLVFISGIVLYGHRTTAQTCHLRISLITVSPGSDLYATFGHSAIRVIDSINGGDYVFNYGTFNFDTPYFYWKFTRGKLMYSLSVWDYSSFMTEYHEEKRKVWEQVLELSCADKEMIWQFLRNNYLPQNRDYKYDFLFDNCSTRIRDIFVRIFGPGWQVANIVPRQALSFREIINHYLKNKPWEKLGINLMFGKLTDDTVNRMQIMFLPDYLMKGIGNSKVNGRSLVKKELVLYDPGPVVNPSYPFYLYPVFLFSLLAVFIILLSFNQQWPLSRAVLPWIDRCMFFLSGLLGFFLLFMWFGTDHQVCRWNFNLLWALPFNLIFSFYLHKNSRGVKSYASLVILLNFILLIGWFVLPQQLPLAVIPLLSILVVRAWHILAQTTMRPVR